MKIYIDLVNNKIIDIDVNPRKYLILLTTCVYQTHKSENENNARKNLYIQQIKKWLDKTNYKICVIESSGYNFENDIKNDRLFCVTFKIQEECKTSSRSESLSILHMLKKIEDKEFYKKCTHILKVTGRYFLEGIKNVLDNLDNSDIHVQIHRNNSERWQNTEYFCIKKELLYELMINVKDNFVEHAFYDFTENKKFCFFGPFKNNIRRGGDNMLIKNL
jgi:hypothetical protein